MVKSGNVVLLNTMIQEYESLESQSPKGYLFARSILMLLHFAHINEACQLHQRYFQNSAVQATEKINAGAFEFNVTDIDYINFIQLILMAVLRSHESKFDMIVQKYKSCLDSFFIEVLNILLIQLCDGLKKVYFTPAPPPNPFGNILSSLMGGGAQNVVDQNKMLD